ncbi:conserved hypothetical protein [Paraburkholderia sabiae]|jgi:hypothetical protein|nr:conserved hypothetical protein [Paraburkholderia sabiae]
MTVAEKSQKQSPAQHIDHENPNAVTSYLLALREPTVSLACSSNDRPDVATAAILGYN